MSTLAIREPSVAEIAAREADLAVTTIQPSRGWVRLNLHEAWQYRELLYFLIWRDLKVRYKQTVLGAAWALLQPVAAMLVFSLFFGKLAKVPSDSVPYPVFVYCALLPWQLFANGVTEAGNSLVAQQSLIKKVYFPRLLLVIAPVFACAVDFVVSFTLLIGLLLFYGIVPSATVVLLPLLVVFTGVTASGVGLWLAALNVQYRDVRYTLPFLIQFWMFATPIVYPSSLVPVQWRPMLGLNPIAGAVEGFRAALLGARAVDWALVGVSAMVSTGLLVSGLVYFRRVERTFADVV